MMQDYTIHLSKDGNAWVAHTEVDMQNGAVGCGNTAKEALQELIINLGIA